MKRVGSLVIVWLLLAGCSSPPERPSKVGLVERSFADETRTRDDGEGERPLPTVLWYPTSDAARETRHDIGPPLLPFFAFGYVARDAPLPREGRLPLVLLSHGTGGSGLDLSWLAEWLAARGYLVASVTHHGNSIAAGDLTPHGFFLFWERARDLTRVLDHLLVDPEIGPRIDPGRIGAAGFSIGGNTVALLAGARIDGEAYFSFCESERARATSCELPPEAPFEREDLDDVIENDPIARASIQRAGDRYRDPRIRAVYSIAPAVVEAFAEAGSAQVEATTRVVVGSLDTLAPPRWNARVLARHAPGATLRELDGVGHYTFLPRCGWVGGLVLGEICEDPPDVDRGAVHGDVAADAHAFFERVLR